jgi:hypothetical protein
MTAHDPRSVGSLRYYPGQPLPLALRRQKLARQERAERRAMRLAAWAVLVLGALAAAGLCLGGCATALDAVRQRHCYAACEYAMPGSVALCDHRGVCACMGPTGEMRRIDGRCAPMTLAVAP